MKLNHSPGPWSFSLEKEGVFDRNGEEVISTIMGKALTEQDEEVMGNLVLAAASPELLRFVKNLKERNRDNIWIQLECDRLIALATEEPEPEESNYE